MNEGDLVAIYETLMEDAVQMGEGRVIGHSRVRARIHGPTGDENWILVARLEEPIYDDGGVTWSEMTEILGHPMTHGLEEISEEKFDLLTRRRRRRD